ncbi:MAG: GspH/FimT family pseudopilin [Gammaproteobacteria bacterium]|nr:GspH/FimT family pseudopilin [Gammaproteobacteria bacterium]MDH5803086.1 GspH/FimT family pseudopilin [Gammaproteobacteria bacterium]
MDSKGFTLVELMVVLALIGIIYALASPMGTLFQNDSAASYMNDFVASTRLARSHAITSNAPVTVCPMAAATQQIAEPECSGATNWEAGWVIFADSNGDGSITNGTAGDTSDDDTILRFYTALPNNFTLRTTRTRITFQSTGMAIGFNGTWTLCDPSRSLQIARGAIIPITGRTHLAVDSDNDRIRESDGTPLECPAPA